MKNKVLKKALVLMMCGALAVPAAGVTRPMVAHATAGTPAVQAEPTGGAGAGVTTGTEKTPAEQLADAKKNALDQLADYYDEEVEMSVQSLMAAMEPMIIIVLAVVVGGLIAACMMPMMQMYTALDSL